MLGCPHPRRRRVRSLQRGRMTREGTTRRDLRARGNRSSLLESLRVINRRHLKERTATFNWLEWHGFFGSEGGIPFRSSSSTSTSWGSSTLRHPPPPRPPDNWRKISYCGIPGSLRPRMHQALKPCRNGYWPGVVFHHFHRPSTITKTILKNSTATASSDGVGGFLPCDAFSLYLSGRLPYSSTSFSLLSASGCRDPDAIDIDVDILDHHKNYHCSPQLNRSTHHHFLTGTLFNNQHCTPSGSYFSLALLSTGQSQKGLRACIGVMGKRGKGNGNGGRYPLGTRNRRAVRRRVYPGTAVCCCFF